MSTNHIRSKWAAVGAAIAVSLGAGGIGITQATTSSGEKPIYLPIEPCRLTDTRAEFQVGPRSAPLGPNETYTLAGQGAVGNCTLPTGTTALSLNVTAINATLPTFVTLFPAGGALPVASHLNPVPGQGAVPNAVNVDLSGGGEFSIYNLQGNVDIIIDVVGIYDDHTHDDRYYTEAEVDAAVDAAVAAGVDGLVESDDGKSAYAWSCAASNALGVALDVTTLCGYSFNPSGSSVTVTRTATGAYTVAFPDLNMSSGHVQVTAYGPSANMCKVLGWGSSTIFVRCFDPAGAAVDNTFTVLALD